MRRRGGAARGVSMGVALMVVALAVTVGFTVAGVSLSHLSYSTHLGSARNARHAAESALAVAVERIKSSTDLAYGSSGHARYDEVLQVGGPDGARAVLAFNPTTAASAGVPASTNNLNSASPAGGALGRTVPAAAAHLIAQGTCGTVVSRMEAVVYIPPFPWVVVSSGPFQSLGGLLVARGNESEVVPIDPSRLDPGSMASNCADRRAILLGPQSLVTGDVSAAGGVVLDPTAVIRGAVNSPTDPVRILQLDPASFDTAGQPGVRVLPARLESPSLSGYCRHEGALDVQGDLVLDGAQVYVTGDLTVSGGIKGKGALVVLGKTSVQSGAAVAAGDLVALIGRGDVTLRGNGKDASAFKGVVYTEGDFTADQITVFGVYIANGAADEATSLGSRITMNNVNMVGVPSMARMRIAVRPPTPAQQPGGAGDFEFLLTTQGLLMGMKVRADESGFQMMDDSGQPIYDPLTEADRAALGVTGTFPIHIEAVPDGGFAVSRADAAGSPHAVGSLGELPSAMRELTGHEMAPQIPAYMPPPDTNADLRDVYTAALFAQHQLLRSLDPNLPPPPPPPGSTTPSGLFELDLDRLISPADRIRVLLWKEI